METSWNLKYGSSYQASNMVDRWNFEMFPSDPMKGGNIMKHTLALVLTPGLIALFLFCVRTVSGTAERSGDHARSRQREGTGAAVSL